MSFTNSPLDKNGFRRTLSAMRRSKSIRAVQSDLHFTISTPKQERAGNPDRRNSLMPQWGKRSESIESLNNWSVISSVGSRTSVLENSLKRVRSARKNIVKKLKLSKTHLRHRVMNKLSKTQVEEVSEDQSMVEDGLNWVTDGHHTSRIVSVKELASFEEYDFVVWNVTPEKKKSRRSQAFFELFKFKK